MMLSSKSTTLIPAPSLNTTQHFTRSRRPHLLHLSRQRCRPTSGRTAVRAVIRSDDKNVTTVSSPSVVVQKPPQPSSDVIEVRAVLTIRNRLKKKLVDKIEDQWDYFVNGIGRGILVQLVSEQIDPATQSGKRSAEAAIRGWLPKPSNHPSIVEYAANFTVQSDFGRPGAVIITSLHDREFHLMEIVVHGFTNGPVFFPANTWIHSRKDSTETRIIFSNQVKNTQSFFIPNYKF